MRLYLVLWTDDSEIAKNYGYGQRTCVVLGLGDGMYLNVDEDASSYVDRKPVTTFFRREQDSFGWTRL